MKNPFKLLALLWALLTASKANGKTQTRTYSPASEDYVHRRTGKQKITKRTHVQRVGGKTIIHQPDGNFSQVGHNKILSLHAMFVQRAGLTNLLRK